MARGDLTEDELHAALRALPPLTPEVDAAVRDLLEQRFQTDAQRYAPHPRPHFTATDEYAYHHQDLASMVFDAVAFERYVHDPLRYDHDTHAAVRTAATVWAEYALNQQLHLVDPVQQAHQQELDRVSAAGDAPDGAVRDRLGLVASVYGSLATDAPLLGAGAGSAGVDAAARGGAEDSLVAAERGAAGVPADEAGVGDGTAPARPAVPCGGMRAPVGKVPGLGAPLLCPEPPAGEPGAGGGGLAQEARVRVHLEQQGYTQPYGSDDNAIAKQLGITGKRADLVMHNPDTGRWLVAESKGGDIDAAYKQLENTTRGLHAQGVDMSDLDIAVYTSSQQYAKLTGPDGPGGWQVRNGYLGWLDEFEQWHYAEIDNVRIVVHSEP